MHITYTMQSIIYHRNGFMDQQIDSNGGSEVVGCGSGNGDGDGGGGWGLLEVGRGQNM